MMTTAEQSLIVDVEESRDTMLVGDSNSIPSPSLFKPISEVVSSEGPFKKMNSHRSPISASIVTASGADMESQAAPVHWSNVQYWHPYFDITQQQVFNVNDEMFYTRV